MKFILTKTVGPNFRTGDLVVSSRARVKELVYSNIAIPEQTLLGLIGCIITCISCLVLFAFGFASFWELQLDVPLEFLSPLWRWTFMLMSLITFFKVISWYRFNKRTHSAIVFAFVFSFFGGIFILMSHLKTSEKFFHRDEFAQILITLVVIGSICIIMSLLSMAHWLSVDNSGQAHTNTEVNFWGFLFWTLYFFVFIVATKVAKHFDKKLKDRKEKYIKACKEKNEYVNTSIKKLNTWTNLDASIKVKYEE